MDDEAAVRQFLGDRPAADELREWEQTLADRLRAFEADRKKEPAGFPSPLDNKIAQLKRQIQALREEAAVTEFVEDSVRVTLAMGPGADNVDERLE